MYRDVGVDMNRVGGPTNALTADFELSTTMGAEGQFFGGERGRYKRTQNADTMTSEQRAMLAGFRIIDTFGGRLGFDTSQTSRIGFRSKELFKFSIMSHQFRRVRKEILAAACVYFVCKQLRVSRSIKELSNVSDVPVRDIARSFLKMKDMKLHKRRLTDTLIAKKSSAALGGERKNADGEKRDTLAAVDEAIPRFCSGLDLPFLIRKGVFFVAKRAAQENIALGQHPATTAACCIALATAVTKHNKRSAKDISLACKIAESTVRSSFKKYYWKKRMTLLPPNYVPSDAIEKLPATLPRTRS
jgi:transcription initiation factor TFIIB